MVLTVTNNTQMTSRYNGKIKHSLRKPSANGGNSERRTEKSNPSSADEGWIIQTRPRSWRNANMKGNGHLTKLEKSKKVVPYSSLTLAIASKAAMCCSATGDIIVLLIQLAIKTKNSKPVCVPAIAFTRSVWFLRNSCGDFSTLCKTLSHTSHGKRWIVSIPQKASGKRLLDRKLINVTHIFRVSNVGHASRYAWPCKMSVFITFGARFREFQSVLQLCFVYVGL